MFTAAHHPEDRLLLVMRLLSDPIRLQILLSIGTREVCLCHILSAVRFPRYKVQEHLLQMKRSEFLIAIRKGPKTNYRLANPEILGLISSAAQFSNSVEWFVANTSVDPLPNCQCPACNGLPTCPRNDKQRRVICWQEQPFEQN
jgi:DNA-binding transcriptional ArsR family regulator